MAHYVYTPKGVCCVQIDFDIDNDVVRNIHFTRGCSGNTQGISRLVVGHKIDEIIALLEGIQCRNGTSCPDQLAQALKNYKVQKDNPEKFE